MDEPLTIRPALAADLRQLLALYRHLDPQDESPSLDLAAERLTELQGLRDSADAAGGPSRLATREIPPVNSLVIR